MNLSIELADDIGTVVKANAQAQGISPHLYVTRVLETTLGPTAEPLSSGPFGTGYGLWAKYGTAPSAEEIDENRLEMFQNFAQDL